VEFQLGALLFHPHVKLELGAHANRAALQRLAKYKLTFAGVLSRSREREPTSVSAWVFDTGLDSNKKSANH